MIIRGFQRYYTDDPADARIARTWMMFHDLVREGGLTVPDPSGELKRLLGVSAKDLWVVGLMIWTIHVSVTSADRRKWVLDPRGFVQEGPRQEEMNALTRQVLGPHRPHAGGVPPSLRGPRSKPRSEADREGHWVSEFDILRDFPVVTLSDGMCIAPFPAFALTRAIDGFYYDLLVDSPVGNRLGAPGQPL